MKKIGGGTRQAGEILGKSLQFFVSPFFLIGTFLILPIPCVVSSVIAAGDLEPPSGEEDEDLAEQSVMATPVAGKKRKESTSAQGSVAQPETSGMVFVFRFHFL